MTSYLRIGINNDPAQVIKLQAFLKVFEKFDYVTVNGVFDETTLMAVNEFQLRYRSEVLAPWGIDNPTGYVYITTLGKINQIVCGSAIPAVHKTTPKPISKEAGIFKEGMGTSTLGSIPVIGGNDSKGQNFEKDRNDPNKSIAAALLSWPSNPVDILQCLYELVLILIVLYILGSVLENVLYKDIPENVRKRFYAKWITMVLGSLLALAGAYLLREWCLLLPLLIAFLLTLGWALSYPKHQLFKDKLPSAFKSS